MSAHFDARRGLAGAQHDRDGTRALGVIDMDRQKAALVVMGVEERELLMPVHDIAGVVDIENDGGGLPIVGGHPLIDERPCQPDCVLQRRGVLKPRHRRLAHQVRAALRQPPAGELEGGVATQAVEIVGVFVAAGDGQDARQHNLRKRVNHPRRITPVGDHGGKLLGDPHPSRCLGKQHHATVGRQPSAVERGGQLLAANGWKREQRRRIVRHGGCGRLDGVDGVGFSNQILRQINRLGYTRQSKSGPVMNKTG